MNHRCKNTLILIALGGAAQLPVTAIANEPDVSRWQCNFCTYAAGWFGNLEIGPGWLSDASSKFSDYRGIEERGMFLSLYGDVHYRGENETYLDLYAIDLGTESRKLEIQAGKRGKYEFSLAYREIPKYHGFGTQSPYISEQGGVLKLPVDWVRASTTGAMPALESSLSDIDLKSLRKTLDTSLSWRLPGNWRYSFDIQHMEKEGTRPFGAGVLTIHSSQFAVPVDFDSDRFSMRLDFNGKRANVNLGLVQSYFNNNVQSVRWENPFSPIGNTENLQAALEPDSAFRQFYVNGLLRLGSSTRLSGSASWGQISQDDALASYSINPDFDSLPLPQSTLGQELAIDTLKLGGRLTTRLSQNLDLSAQWKVDERDNSSPVALYTPVITDLAQRTETANRPYSFERRQSSATLSYRARPGVRLLAGVKQKDYTRSIQSVRKSEDTNWWGEFNFDHWENAQLRMRLEQSDRDVSPYLQVSDTGLQENPLMRKFNLAGRKREREVFEIDLSLTVRLQAGLSISTARDDYQESILGLLESKEHSYHLDLAWSPGRQLNMYLFASRDRFDSTISGAPFDTTVPWVSMTQDRFTTFGVGLSGRLNDKVEIDADLVNSDSRGRIATVSGAVNAPFPELETELSNVRIRLTYRQNQHWSWALHAEHERYNSSDWQIDGLGVDGISAILNLGTESPDYSVSLLRLMARYRF